MVESIEMSAKKPDLMCGYDGCDLLLVCGLGCGDALLVAGVVTYPGPIARH